MGGWVLWICRMVILLLLVMLKQCGEYFLYVNDSSVCSTAYSYTIVHYKSIEWFATTPICWLTFCIHFLYTMNMFILCCLLIFYSLVAALPCCRRFLCWMHMRMSTLLMWILYCKHFGNLHNLCSMFFFCSVRSGQVRNLDSAKVSMVGQVKR